MNLRTTGVLFVVALALGSFIYFYEIRGAEVRADADAADKRLFPGLDAESVEQLRLKTEDGVAVEIERRPDGWRIVAPVDFPADDVTVDGMVSALTQLSRETEVQDPQSPEIYGLGDGGDVVHFRAAGEPRGLRLGGETPVGANAYVSALAAESASVSIVAAWRVNSFRRELSALRDARIAHFDRTAVRGLALTWPDGGVTLRRTGVDDDGLGGEWRLIDPVEAAADQQQVDNLLSDLSFLSADGFVDELLSDAEAGLSEPELSVELTLIADTGAEVTRRFAIGAPFRDGDRLVRAAEASLYRISEERIDDFPRSVFAYRFKQLSRFDTSRANRIELVYRNADPADPASQSERIVLSEREGVWDSDRGSVSQEATSRFVAELADLDASAIIADAMGGAEVAALGLDPALLQIRVFAVPRAGGRDESAAAGEPVESEAAERLAEVLLGRSDTAWGIAARVADRPLIYAVDAAREVQLPMTLGRFDAELLVPEPSAKATDEVRAPAEIEPELEAGFAPEFEPELDPRVESAGDAVER